MVKNWWAMAAVQDDGLYRVGRSTFCIPTVSGVMEGRNVWTQRHTIDGVGRKKGYFRGRGRIDGETGKAILTLKPGNCVRAARMDVHGWDDAAGRCKLGVAVLRGVYCISQLGRLLGGGFEWLHGAPSDVLGA